MNWEVITFAIYFIALLFIAATFYFNGSNRNSKDFFLGGRSMGPWVAALSAQASDMSAWMLMGLPGSIFAFGFGQMWIGIGLILGTAANWIICAKRLRTFSKAANDSITIPQYLTNRFAVKNKSIQTICAIIFLFCYTIYVASAIVAGTSVFAVLFPEMPNTVAMIIFIILIIGYTFFGGFKSVCVTDFFQGSLMLFALLAVPIIVICFHNNLLVPDALNTVFNYVDNDGSNIICNFGNGLFSASWQDIISGLGWGLAYFGVPHIIVRFMSIEKPSMIKKSACVAITWIVLSLTATVLIAYFGRMIMGQELLQGGIIDGHYYAPGSQKLVFVAMSRSFFPPAICGLLLAAIIAASISTADSQLLVASSSFTADLYKPLFHKNASEKELLMVGRIIVIVISIIGFIIASAKGSGAQAIMDMVENAWGVFGSSFGTCILLTLFWKRFNYPGAIAAITTGFIVDVGWLITGLSSSTGVYELIPGFFASLLFAVIITLNTKAPNKKAIKIYEKAISPDAE